MTNGVGSAVSSFPWHDYFGLHEIILYVVVLLLISALGGGPVLRALFNSMLKIFGKGGGETVINLGGNMRTIPKECEGCGLMVDPTKCVMHQSEHERSLRNQEEIKSLWENYGKMRTEMNDGFKEIRVTIMSGQTAILKAIGKRPTDWEDGDDSRRGGGGGGFRRKDDE
jgi:hypothetical protein